MVYSTYTKLRILHYSSKGFRSYTIANLLEKYDNITVSIRGVAKFLKVYEETNSIARRPGSGRATKITATVKQLVEEQMVRDDETTATQLHKMLLDNGIDISLRTILRCRQALGWTFCGSAYCQLIRDVNKEKRVEWVREYQHDNFDNVLWTDECTVQLENHRRFCCRKKGQRPKPKPRPKHSIKVHVWAGISKQGKSKICVFDGVVDRYLFTEILETSLLPSIAQLFPGTHRFMQDNDPKHSSHYATQFLIDNNVVWWKTPAESPDLNSIENLWHELKEFIRREIKPKTKDELIQGILTFWESVDKEKCVKYINHLKKVIPRVIE